MHKAVWHGSPDMIRYLIQRGADIHQKVRDDTPLHIATMMVIPQAVKVLVVDGNADTSVRNKVCLSLTHTHWLIPLCCLYLSALNRKENVHVISPLTGK